LVPVTRTATLPSAGSRKESSWNRTCWGSLANASRMPPHAPFSGAQSLDRWSEQIQISVDPAAFSFT
jgi:hypothetical protein